MEELQAEYNSTFLVFKRLHEARIKADEGREAFYYKVWFDGLARLYTETKDKGTDKEREYLSKLKDKLKYSVIKIPRQTRKMGRDETLLFETLWEFDDALMSFLDKHGINIINKDQGNRATFLGEDD